MISLLVDGNRSGHSIKLVKIGLKVDEFGSCQKFSDQNMTRVIAWVSS